MMNETPQYDAVEQQLAVRGEKTAELPFYHTECEGLILPPFMKKEQAGIYANNFKMRPGDVFIASFPKSGTNWLAYVVQQIANPIPPYSSLNVSNYRSNHRGLSKWDMFLLKLSLAIRENPI
jgi:hypothetical protein